MVDYVYKSLVKLLKEVPLLHCTMVERVSSGTQVIDSMLLGGYEKGVITTIYGPGGSGKTNLCILCAVSVALNRKKVIYVDTEGNFSLDRLKQITGDYKRVLEKMLFFRPARFEEQKKAFESLKDAIKDSVGIIIVDTIAMLYRLEMARVQEVYGINRELGVQMSYLSEIARKKDLPVLVTNQVYADFDNKNRVNMVGGDIIKYSSKCLIELQTLRNGLRGAILRKHRSLPEGKSAMFRIVEKGIEDVKEKGG